MLMFHEWELSCMKEQEFYYIKFGPNSILCIINFNNLNIQWNGRLQYFDIST